MKPRAAPIALLILLCGAIDSAQAQSVTPPNWITGEGTTVTRFAGTLVLTTYYPNTETTFLNSAGQQTLTGNLVTHPNTWVNCPATSEFPFISDGIVPSLPYLMTRWSTDYLNTVYGGVEVGTPESWGGIAVTSTQRYASLPDAYDYLQYLASGLIRLKADIYFDVLADNYNAFPEAEFHGIASSAPGSLLAGTFTWHSDIYGGDNLYCSYRLFMMQSAIVTPEPFSLLKTVLPYVRDLVTGDSKNTSKTTRGTAIGVRS